MKTALAESHTSPSPGQLDGDRDRGHQHRRRDRRRDRDRRRHRPRLGPARTTGAQPVPRDVRPADGGLRHPRRRAPPATTSSSSASCRRSTTSADVHDFWLTVGRRRRRRPRLRPTIVTGGKRAMLDATITNTGNAAATITGRRARTDPPPSTATSIPARFVLGPGAPAVCRSSFAARARGSASREPARSTSPPPSATRSSSGSPRSTRSRASRVACSRP